MAETVSVRVDRQELLAITKLSRLERKKKSEILRELLGRGIGQKRLEMALDRFRRNEATAWKAARMAGLPLTVFLDVLAEKRIDFNFSAEELEKEVEEML